MHLVEKQRRAVVRAQDQHGRRGVDVVQRCLRMKQSHDVLPFDFHDHSKTTFSARRAEMGLLGGRAISAKE